MQIIDHDQAPSTETKPGNTGKKFKLALETIVDAASAKRAARKGAIGGFIFAGMYVFGAVIFALGYSPVSGQQDTAFQDDFIVYLITEALLVAIILFLAWRVSTGRGYVSAALLAVWFVFEIVTKIANGSANVGWMFFYLIIFLCMIDGIRGTWLGRRYKKEEVQQRGKPSSTVVRG